MLQHAVVGLGTNPVAPLRLDNADGPSSSKMVSLADLHVNGGASVTPQHTMDTQVRFLRESVVLLPWCLHRGGER